MVTINFLRLLSPFRRNTQWLVLFMLYYVPFHERQRVALNYEVA